MLLSILLFLVGLIGGSLPLFFNRDGSSLIIIGFGAGLLLMHNAINKGKEKAESKGAVIPLTIAAFIAGIASIIFNVLKYSANFNKVLSVGFVILLIWEIILIITALKLKAKK